MRTAVALLLALAALAIGACGSDEKDEGGSAQPQGARLRITLGTQDFPEARLLGELWRQALAVNGYAVDLRKRIGPTEDLDRAVRERCDVWLTELKAAAIDTVAARAGAEGARIVFVRNRPAGDGLDDALVKLHRDRDAP